MRYPEEFVGLVPDHVEIAGTRWRNVEARRSPLAVFESREVGGRNPYCSRHLFLRHALRRRSSRTASPKGSHDAPPFARASRT